MGKLQMLAVTAVVMPFVQACPVEPLARESLTVFPEEIGQWEGTPEILQENTLQSLDLTDYGCRYIGACRQTL